jgi:hypothetical protein
MKKVRDGCFFLSFFFPFACIAMHHRCLALRVDLTNTPAPPGLRIVRPDWHASAAARRFRDRSRLHLHHTQAATACHEARGQEPHPGTLQQHIALSHCIINTPHRPV